MWFPWRLHQYPDGQQQLWHLRDCLRGRTTLFLGHLRVRHKLVLRWLLQRQHMHGLRKPKHHALWHRGSRLRLVQRGQDLPERRMRLHGRADAVWQQRHLHQHPDGQRQLWHLWDCLRGRSAMLERHLRVRRKLVLQRLLQRQRVCSGCQPDREYVRRRKQRQRMPGMHGAGVRQQRVHG
jgi:hypothetical protein